ncbi:MAG: cytosine-specific methyltransferase [Candidatus Campbellbacteria bacterium]
MAKGVQKPIRVAELFAGVGGFHVGLKKNRGYEIVWANQWEPATKRQHAFEVYASRFPDAVNEFSNIDIAKVHVDDIPDHDLLVGGFPCQDYSVARTLSQAVGINGKKGVLWWEIHRILKEKGSRAPKFLMLENVDRLLKSPVSQRGRDFAIMLASLSDLGYAVEWRVINAADYGMPQRRRRVFMLGYKKGTKIHKELLAHEPSEWLVNKGLTARAFPVEHKGDFPTFKLDGRLHEISKGFGVPGKTPFGISGLMFDRKVWTANPKPFHAGEPAVLEDVLLHEKEVPNEFFIPKSELPRWKYLKGAKKEKRNGKNGFEFTYNEGPVAFPDYLDRPSRTIVTGEGGPTPSRFKHVVKTPSGKLRRLTPLELERLCMFPDNHTVGMPDAKRAFFMGNALVVGVIERLGRELAKRGL